MDSALVPADDDADIGNPQAPPGWKADDESALDPSYVRKLRITFPVTSPQFFSCSLPSHCPRMTLCVLSQVISLVRALLPVPSGGGAEEGEVDVEKKEKAREEAGCMLWDLSAVPVHASFLVETALLPEARPPSRPPPL